MIKSLIYQILIEDLLSARYCFPDGSDGKKKICLQCRRPMLDPWVGKIPWRRE